MMNQTTWRKGLGLLQGTALAVGLTAVLGVSAYACPDCLGDSEDDAPEDGSVPVYVVFGGSSTDVYELTGTASATIPLGIGQSYRRRVGYVYPDGSLAMSFRLTSANSQQVDGFALGVQVGVGSSPGAPGSDECGDGEIGYQFEITEQTVRDEEVQEGDDKVRYLETIVRLERIDQRPPASEEAGEGGEVDLGPNGIANADLSLGDGEITDVGELQWDGSDFEDAISLDSLTVKSDNLPSDAGVMTDVIYDGSSDARQVITKNATATGSATAAYRVIHIAPVIQASTPIGFTVDFYAYDSGDPWTISGDLYDLSGRTPGRSWSVVQDTSASDDRLVITSTRGSEVRVQRLIYSPSTATIPWKALLTGEDDLEKRVTRSYEETTMTIGGNSVDVRIETITETNETTSAVLSKKKRIYREYDFLPEGPKQIYQEITDPDGEALVQQWEYHTNINDEDNYGQLAGIRYPDGRWQKFFYSSTVEGAGPVYEIASWKDITYENGNDTNARRIDYSYDGSGLETEEIEGYEVRKSSNFENYYSPSGYLEVSKSRYASGSFTGMLEEVTEPGGRVTTYTYALGTWNGSAFTEATGGLFRRTIATVEAISGPVNNKSTRTTTVTNLKGQVVMEQEEVYASGYQTARTVVHTYSGDHLTQSVLNPGANQRIIYQANYVNDRLDYEIDETGVRRDYTYYAGSDLVETVTKEAAGTQADVVTTYEYDVLGRERVRTVSGGSLAQETSQDYDVAGRLTASTDESGLATVHAYENLELSGSTIVTRRSETITRPSGAKEVRSYYLDGQIKTIDLTDASDNVLLRRTYDYSVAEGFKITEEKAFKPGDTNYIPRVTRTKYDMMGRVVERKVSGPNSESDDISELITETRTYNSTSGLLETISAPDRPTQDFGYDALGDQILTGLGSVDPAVGYQVSKNERTYVMESGEVIEVDTSGVYTGTATFLTTAVVKRQLTGLSATTMAKTTSIDALGLETITTTLVDQPNKTVTTTVDVPDASNHFVSTSVNGLQTETVTPSVPSPATTYHYDDLERLVKIVDSRGKQQITAYYGSGASAGSRGRVASVTEWHASSEGTPPATSYTYYGTGVAGAGQVQTITRPLGQTVTTAYDVLGQATGQSSTGAYPLEYTYTPFGELETLTTHGDAGASVTTWAYNPAGLLATKTDEQSRVTDYDYDDAGRLVTRTWARNIPSTSTQVATTYIYNSSSGFLTDIDYNDATPDVVFTHDRAGRRTGMTDAAGVRTWDLADNGVLESEDFTSGLADVLTLETPLTSLGQRASVTLKKSTTPVVSQSYAWTATTGRLDTAAQGSATVTVGYTANSNLPGATTFAWSGTKLTTTPTFDDRNRLDLISNTGVGGVGTVSSHDYTYDDNNRRTVATLPGGHTWNYGYNDRDEVTSGKKKLDGSTFAIGQQFEYTFDTIGNRTNAKRGGDASGTGLVTDGYTPNDLNQYASQTVNGQVFVLGEAVGGSDLRVNDDPVTWQGDIFSKALTASNGSGPVALDIELEQISPLDTVLAQDAGHVLVPPQSRSFAYDEDGNLLSDGLWDYTWDAENRLVSMTSVSSLPATARRRLEFAYDGLSRRLWKKAYTWDGSAWVLQDETRFVYDGWNLIAECDASWNVVRSYLWALDLSGTFQGAGGVGGLAAITVASGELAGTYFPAYDGNGNITALIAASDGSVAARYDYGPFGEPLRESGAMASANPFRFSTKYTDQESGLLYYGYRYYYPEMGRWVNRDPIGEAGGYNLYSFVSNRPSGFIDVWGLEEAKILVRKCEIVLLFQHSNPDRSPKPFELEDKCSAAGFLGCYPGLGNKNIPEDQRIPLLPEHNEQMSNIVRKSPTTDAKEDLLDAIRDLESGMGSEQLRNDEEAQRERAKYELNYDKAIDNALKGIEDKAKELCERCCKQDPGYVTVRTIDGGGIRNERVKDTMRKIPCH